MPCLLIISADFGNIPYNITSPIIFWLIDQLDYWSDTFIMMQKKLQIDYAKVGTKAYGRHRCSWCLFRYKTLFYNKAECFYSQA